MIEDAVSLTTLILSSNLLSCDVATLTDQPDNRIGSGSTPESTSFSCDTFCSIGDFKDPTVAALKAVGREIANVTSFDLVGFTQNNAFVKDAALAITSAMFTGQITPDILADLKRALHNPTDCATLSDCNMDTALGSAMLYKIVEDALTKIPTFFSIVSQGVIAT